MVVRPSQDFAVHFLDDVARTNAGLIRRRADERRQNHGLVLALLHGHAHAVVFSLLFFLEEGVLLGVEEIGVRIQHAQHAGDRAVVDHLVGIHRLGVIALHDGQHVREGLYRVLHVVLSGSRRAHRRPIQAAQYRGNTQYHYQDNDTAP